MTAMTIAATDFVAGPRLNIDLHAVAANTRVFVARAQGEVMAVVKADGFGHGAIDVARTALANGATRLGVTSLSEATALRAGGLRAPVLSWLNAVDADWASAVRHDVEVAVPSLAHLDAIVNAATGARVHLHLDTGMARDGASPSEWGQLCRAARRAERHGRLRVVGVMGHLGCADVPVDGCNRQARQLFMWGVRSARSAGLRPQHRHLAATAATLTDSDAHHTMSRIGAGLVGIDPSRTVDLEPALSLTAPLVSVRTVPAGARVGYGHAWTTPAPTRLGLLPVGYADGLPRIASGQAEVQVGGQRRPLVGRISMDMVVVDLGDVVVAIGDDAVVLGPGHAGEPTVREWAGWADTLEHEIVTGLGARVRRTTSGAATHRHVRQAL
ncbi:alanine racemase [Nocardioides zhouii]|uniref:Alanine racemase n=1 Tax=Nocardioides zhouii TaxID=1168729 RepID=A0A4Q2SNK1_9ACTN|nr:alanine racemase [Nocardioides zhouii]RYC05784.1 alanine racemase [Nocardioides zhouii]